MTAKSANLARSCLLQLPAVLFAENVSGGGSIPASCANGVALMMALKVTRSQRFSWVERLAEDSVSLKRRSRIASPLFSGSTRSRAHPQSASVRIAEANVSGLKPMVLKSLGNSLMSTRCFSCSSPRWCMAIASIAFPSPLSLSRCRKSSVAAEAAMSEVSSSHPTAQIWRTPSRWAKAPFGPKPFSPVLRRVRWRAAQEHRSPLAPLD